MLSNIFLPFKLIGFGMEIKDCTNCSKPFTNIRMTHLAFNKIDVKMEGIFTNFFFGNA
jgi:hypothetical protein